MARGKCTVHAEYELLPESNVSGRTAGDAAFVAVLHDVGPPGMPDRSRNTASLLVMP